MAAMQDDAFAYCAGLVRTADRDRYIAALFAPSEHRDGLHALYAFDSEIVRVPDAARGVLPGEIRLQWWREVVEKQRDAEAGANPVAATLAATIERYRLAPQPLIDLIEAHRLDLYDEPVAYVADLEIYARKTASALFGLAAQILGEVVPDEICRSAGIAYAIAGILRAFPRHAVRRRLYVPLEILDRHAVAPEQIFAGQSSPGVKAALAELRALARGHLATVRERASSLPQNAVPAFLPLAPVRASLARLERGDPLAPTDIAPWRRQWLIWRAARDPARIAG